MGCGTWAASLRLVRKCSVEVREGVTSGHPVLRRAGGGRRTCCSRHLDLVGRLVTDWAPPAPRCQSLKKPSPRGWNLADPVPLFLRANGEEPTRWATPKPSASTPKNAARTRVSPLMPMPERRGRDWQSDGRDVLSWSKRPRLRPKGRPYFDASASVTANPAIATQLDAPVAS